MSNWTGQKVFIKTYNLGGSSGRIDLLGNRICKQALRLHSRPSEQI